jgi:hypothetical protein
MLCTFIPSEAMPYLDHTLFCDDSYRPQRDCGPTRFELVPSGWFREAASTTPAVLRNLELAARPDRFPPLSQNQFDPVIPRKCKIIDEDDLLLKEEEEQEEPEVTETARKNVKMGVGQKKWTVCTLSPPPDRRRKSSPLLPAAFRLTRTDNDAYFASWGIEVPLKLYVEEVKIPLIDLFAPRRSTKERLYREPSTWDE